MNERKKSNLRRSNGRHAIRGKQRSDKLETNLAVDYFVCIPMSLRVDRSSNQYIVMFLFEYMFGDHTNNKTYFLYDVRFNM